MSSAVERLDSFTLCLYYTSPALKIFSFLLYYILLHSIVINYIVYFEIQTEECGSKCIQNFTPKHIVAN